MTEQHTSPDFDTLRDDLVAAGFFPADHHPDSTISYFAARGWDAARENGDSLSFVRFSDEGAKLMHTTLSGVINTEASFTVDRTGLRLLAICAEARA